MRILQLHNRYQITGGEEGVVQAEQELLRQFGHRVELLAVSNDQITNGVDQAIAAVNAMYSRSAKQQVLAHIDQFQPDVVHVHNFFPLLSPSVYDACHDRGVPVVQTLHNYRLACPKAMFFRDGQICETCLEQGSPWPGVKYGCYRGSAAQTAVVAAMLTLHGWRKTWQERVDAFICLTDFQRQKLVAAGLPADRMHVKPNFLFAPTMARSTPAVPFVLSVGRLAEEKGIDLAIAAYSHDPNLPRLKIVGDGPARSALEQQVIAANLSDRITFLGRQDKAQVLELMQQAIALVFPSIWYEGFPLTIVEAFGCGLPVIAANLGSMAEIVEDQRTGRHFAPQDAVDLAAKIADLANHPDRQQTLSANAYQTYQQRYTPEININQLVSIYQSIRPKLKAVQTL
jgi:glycosyltransferase involved in cell wall biosynthesis